MLTNRISTTASQGCPGFVLAIMKLPILGHHDNVANAEDVGLLMGNAVASWASSVATGYDAVTCKQHWSDLVAS